VGRVVSPASRARTCHPLVGRAIVEERLPKARPMGR
jgi:hypothetical protein